MMRLHAGLLLVAALYVGGAHLWATESNRALEDSLMKTYNRKHRPVKKESTVTQIQIYLLISHVEKVDEHEQTMMLHGLLWATWVDEYLRWDPTKYNNTRRIAIESWKIWQPSLSLYNSARGNSWFLHMGGLPASVNSDGKVWSSGSFSFYVTCMFDFTNYPFDEQECPIVIADWVYDLSKVNLSDPSGNTPWNKPAVKLSYDPLSNTNPKKHAAGWEVRDTWRRQCYWGPAGCKDEPPEGQPEWFWSLIEFGIRIKRQAPYFGLTVLLPSVSCTCENSLNSANALKLYLQENYSFRSECELVTSVLTLAVFWIDTSSLAIAVTTFNILLQGLFGWDLIRKLPPGSGTTPKIVSLYGFNLSLTAIAFVLHVIINYLENTLPDDIELPFQARHFNLSTSLTNVTERLRQMSPFKVKGLSFDPQQLLTGESEEESFATIDPDQNPSSILVMESESNRGDDDPTFRNHVDSNEIALEDASPTVPTSQQPRKSLSHPLNSELGHIAQQLYIVRRLMFFIYLLMYVITLPICLF
ncbi:unnamed protein product [Anisakis simplex]|uniref:Neur_chan_LBD domain-containing protein n=1 Tax=Anisakis simplex TaxID=6269 RepID=A0A0M3K4C3_ANISI|nr:unnamed protein product [Anisakis simplex]